MGVAALVRRPLSRATAVIYVWGWPGGGHKFPARKASYDGAPDDRVFRAAPWRAAAA